MIIFLIIIGILNVLFFGICTFCTNKSLSNTIDDITDEEYEEWLKNIYKEDERNNTGRG